MTTTDGVNVTDNGPVATPARPNDGSERVMTFSRTDLPAPTPQPRLSATADGAAVTTTTATTWRNHA